MAKDITNIVEAPAEFQDRARIKITGIYASVSKSDDEHDVTINGQISPVKGDSLEANINITAIIYDGKGRVLGKSEEYIEESDFYKFVAFSINLYVSSAPAKILLVSHSRELSPTEITINLD